jgi:hypothetical protein
MTDDRVLELVREVWGARSYSEVEDVIRIAIRETVEECAQVCDQIEEGEYPNGDRASGVAWECANAIRERFK